MSEQRLRAAVAALTAAAMTTIIQLTLLIALDARAAERGIPLRKILTKWDADWLTNISEHSYYASDVTQSVAFFPGYPTLVRIVGAPAAVLGINDATLLTALLVSIVSTAVAAAGLGFLALEIWSRLGRPTTLVTLVVIPAGAAVLFSGAPMSVVYWLPYSEATFTAFAVWALLALLRGRYLTTGLLMLAAGLTRVTGAALVVVLVVAALVELVRWWRGRAGCFPWRALVAPVIGGAGIACYLAWASAQTRSAGGYFAIQRQGWGSGWDWGDSTWRWIRSNLVGELPGYTVTTWAIITVLALAVASLWPLLRGGLPWQIWLAAVVVMTIVLGSGGILHSRPRLLLLATALLTLPWVVRLIDAATRMTGWRRWITVSTLTFTSVAWCCLGFKISLYMLVDFPYGI